MAARGGATMSDGRYPFTTLEMELIAIAGHDYESLQSIREVIGTMTSRFLPLGK